MASRHLWRLAVLGTVGMTLTVLPAQVRASTGSDKQDQSHGGKDERDKDGRDKDGRDKVKGGDRPKGGGRAPTGVERYNPDIDSNRVVFTQVDRRKGGTTASVWSRDLTSGNETLVADVGTGEPWPVASGQWTAWSEVAGPGDPGRTVVRARSTASRAVLDVFATDVNPLAFPYSSTNRLSVDMSGDILATSNGLYPGADGSGRQLVRFTLPSTQPSFVDVMTTSSGSFDVGVAQSGGTSVITLDNGTLFSVVDASGRVVAAPTAGDCFPVGGRGTRQPAIDGSRVVATTVCPGPDGYYQFALASCVLPCDLVNFTFVDPNSNPSTAVALSGTLAAWSSSDPFSGNNAVWVADLASGGPPRAIHRTSGTIGPRVSISGQRVVWDETTTSGGVTRSAIYLRDLSTSTTTILGPGRGTEVVPEANGPLRLNPDVSAGRVAYTEVARDGSSAGIWTRALGGPATLVSASATDTSQPRLGDGWMAWNTRTPGASVEKVVATTGPGAPLVDVYSTDLAPVGDVFFTPDFPATAQVDVGGTRAVVTARSVEPDAPFNYPQQHVFGFPLPGGPLTPLAPLGSPFFGFLDAQNGRTNGRFTAAFETTYGGGIVDLFDETGALRQLSLPLASFGNACSPGGLDLTSTRLVVGATCYGGPTDASQVLWCDLPCAGGFTGRVAIPGESDPFFSGGITSAQLRTVSASGDVAVITRETFARSGRYGDRYHRITVVERVDLGRARGPFPVTAEAGTVSEARTDGDTIVWSVDRREGGRIGTVYVHEIRRGRTTAL